MKYSFGFLGCGNMGSALCGALSKTLTDEHFAVYNPHKIKADNFASGKKNVVSVSKDEVLQNSRYIVLAMKPDKVKASLTDASQFLKDRKDEFIIVSMAAGVSIKDITVYLGFDCPVIRIMPNLAVSVFNGIVLFTCNKYSSKYKEDFQQQFAGTGLVDELEETKLDAASAVAGCAPAFVYMFAEALADGAVECGVPRDKADSYAAYVLGGAAKMLLETDKHPGKLKDDVCSPGGTTIAGVHSLEKDGFRGAVMNAVSASFEKNKNLKKN